MAKLDEIRIGQVWSARVSGRYVHVKIEAIDHNTVSRQRLLLRNLSTQRELQRSPAFLRRKIREVGE